MRFGGPIEVSKVLPMRARVCACGSLAAKHRTVCDHCRYVAKRKLLPCRECGGPKEDGQISHCLVCSGVYSGRRVRHIAREYGVPLSEALRLASITKCEVCGEGPKANEKYLHVDHDHESGRVRGVLCRSCNHCLGFARDNPGLLRALAFYLE